MKAIAIPQTAVQPKPQFTSTRSQKGKLVAQWLRVDDKLVCQWFTV